MQRREFLHASLALAAVSLPGCSQSRQHNGTLVSATYDDKGGYQLLLQELNSRVIAAYQLPFRGHQVIADKQHILVFGRRPESRCMVIDRNNETSRLIHAAPDRHFYGHGQFYNDVLLTTENNYQDGNGVIGIRDRSSFKSLGEYPSYGIGPHDCQVLPDGNTLVVANGGIQTHPATGYRTLNKDHISPSLVTIDIASGQKIDEYRLTDNLLSIRHLAVGSHGEIGVALQYQGNWMEQTPESLVAWQTPGGSLSLLKSDRKAINSMQGYMGDIAWHPASNVLAVSSPKGNQVTFWNPQEQNNSWNLVLQEACAITTNDTGFIVTTQTGSMHFVEASHTPVKPMQLLGQQQSFAWDNHARLLT